MRPRREIFRQSEQTYFVTFQTARRQCFFRNERWAVLMVETLSRYSTEFELHDFVVMHDHLHLLLSPHVPLEKVVQLLKGGFSYQARRAFDWKSDIWQAGFSDHRIRDARDWEQHVAYVAKNVASLRVVGYRFCGVGGGVPLAAVPPWLKPLQVESGDGGPEGPPLQNVADGDGGAEAPSLQSVVDTQ